MKLTDFDALIFDSDGVLVDSEVIHIAVEQELLRELGLTYDTKTYQSRFVGLSNPDFYSQLRSDYETRIGGEFPNDFRERLQARIWPRVERELQPIAGVRELVEAFGKIVAVASSAPYGKLIQKLHITGLFELFSPSIFSVDHVKRGKPDPDLFLHAAAQIDVDAARCVVIEDSVNGVRAARAANMVTLGFVGGGHADEGLASRLSESGAELVVSSHAEIANLL